MPLDLENARSWAEEIFLNCSVTTGYCCCGEPMEGHSDPMCSGHTPVDRGEYEVSRWLENYKTPVDNDPNCD